MKKHLYFLAVLGLLFSACNDDELIPTPAPVENPLFEQQAIVNETTITTLLGNVLTEAISAESQVPDGDHPEGTQFSFGSLCPAVTYVSGYPAGGIPNTLTINFGQYCQLPTGLVVTGIVKIYSLVDLVNCGPSAPAYLSFAALTVNGCKVDINSAFYPFLAKIKFFKKPNSNEFLFYLLKPAGGQSAIVVQNQDVDAAGGKTISTFYPPVEDPGGSFDNFLSVVPQSAIALDWSVIQNTSFEVDFGGPNQDFWDANTKYFPDFNAAPATFTSNRDYKVGVADSDPLVFNIGLSKFPCSGTLQLTEGQDSERNIDFTKTYQFGYDASGLPTADCPNASHTFVSYGTRPFGSTSGTPYSMSFSNQPVYPN